jgi:hypothetical protein
VLQLQRQYGNRYVQRMLGLVKNGEDETMVTPDVEEAIKRSSGKGQALDGETRERMESAFGIDFGDVRVHADAEADAVTRSLDARAFTVDQDVFFQHGAYNPGASSGRELLAHELTHVVQQGSGQVQPKLVVNQPGDRYEQEADRVARAIVEQDQHAVPGNETVSQEMGRGDGPLLSRVREPVVQRGNDYPTISSLSSEDAEQLERQQHSFELQVLAILALGPFLKIDFQARGSGHTEWIPFHFFGIGLAAAIEIPILRRPASAETVTTRHVMSVLDLMGSGRVILVGVPHTDIKYLRLFFVSGPERAGYATVDWTLSTGIDMPYGGGLYTGRFERGHSVQA